MTKTFEALSAGDTLELRIYGVIGSRWDDGVTSSLVAAALQNAPNAKSILVRMSSPGGAAFEGNAIRSMLAAHPARVTCEIEGLAASAASVIAMSADTIRMHEGSAMMIHEASTWTEGDAQEHQRAIDALTTLNDGMASIYAARSGMDKKQCLKLMAAETWLTPAQAVEKKLADEVVAGKQSAAAPMAFDLKQFGYRNAPEKFTAAATTAPQMETTKMSLAQIATALGLDSAADAAAVMASLGKLQSQLGAAERPLAELRALTGAGDNVALLGAVRGIAETAKQVPALKSQLEAAAGELAKQADAMEEQRRDAIIAADKADPKGRKLTPALETFWTEKDKETGKAKRSVAELEAYMAAAAHQVVVATTVVQPKVKTSVTPTAAATGGGGIEPVTHEGKTWEQMEPWEKQNLFVDLPEVYAALQANWKERGKPRAQTSKRASA